MKNFQFISEIIDFINTIDKHNSDIHITSVDKLENEISRFKATNEIKDFEVRIFNIPVERLIFFRLNDNNIIAIHIFIKPTNNLADLIEADLGNYYMTAGWGTQENASLKIISWNNDSFSIDLRKNVKNLDANYMSLPPYDIITISNDVYRKLK